MKIDLDREDITQLLHRWNDGDERARNALLERLYAKMQAAAQAARPRDGMAASLVHDAIVHLIGEAKTTYRDRTHFAGTWATVMRNLLVDRHRRSLLRRPRDRVDEAAPANEIEEMGVEGFDTVKALLELAHVRKEAADAITLKICGGLNVEEIAALSECSVATVGRQLRFAKFFLRTRLSESRTQDSG